MTSTEGQAKEEGEGAGSTEGADEVRKRKEERLRQAITLICAFIALLFVAYNVHEARKPPGLSLRAPFTRVGGDTRVDTALEASRFWRATDTDFVEVAANAPMTEIWSGVECALRQDDQSPLLFVPKQDVRSGQGGGTRSPEARILAQYRRGVAALGGQPIDCSESPRSLPHQDVCTEHEHWSVYFGPSTVGYKVPATQLTWPSWVPLCQKLNPTVVVASAKTPTDAPDVAVALVLARQLASREQPVSVLVIPRYLESDLALEAELRRATTLVGGGVLLGESRRIPAETTAKLRSVVAGRSGWADKASGALPPIEAIALALLAVWGLRQIPKALPDALLSPVTTIREKSKEWWKLPRWLRLGGSSAPGENVPRGSGDGGGGDMTAAQQQPKADTSPGWPLSNARVTVELASGIAWFGTSEEPPTEVGGTSMLKLVQARRVNPPSTSEDVHPVVLLRWSEVLSVAQHREESRLFPDPLR